MVSVIELNIFQISRGSMILSNYKKPIVFKNGFRTLGCIFFGLAAIYFTFIASYLFFEFNDTKIIYLCLFMFSASLSSLMDSYHSISEIRKSEVTIRSGNVSRYIPIINIRKAVISKWKLRIYFLDDNREESVVLPGGTTEKNRIEILNLLTQSNEKILIQEL